MKRIDGRRIAQPFVTVIGPLAGSSEKIATHALGRHISRMNEIFSMIGQQLVIKLKTTKMPTRKTIRVANKAARKARTSSRKSTK